jgi:hypothetical protein
MNDPLTEENFTAIRDALKCTCSVLVEAVTDYEEFIETERWYEKDKEVKVKDMVERSLDSRSPTGDGDHDDFYRMFSEEYEQEYRIFNKIIEDLPKKYGERIQTKERVLEQASNSKGI